MWLEEQETKSRRIEVLQAEGAFLVKQDFLNQLQNPPKSFRPIPFWSWNDKLDPHEVRRQIQEMNRVGIGGYFMHARGGLQTPYMGREWMENIAAGIDEGRRHGMGAWVYDENGWPSGFGDGKVNGRGEAFQQKYLRCEAVKRETVREDGHTITNAALADGRILHFYYDINPFYVDTLDGQVVKTFLDAIYQPYFAHFGDDFGGAMPGFFTDEPQVSRSGIPWSFVMPAAYRATYSEELLPLLPQLFLPIDSYRRTRYRFWHLVQELFVVNFTKQIYDWCTEHHAKLTGHMVLEERFLGQLTSNAAVMPHYEYFHMPGMDWLGRHINPPTTPLQAASVSHQLGKKQILSETFALTGWNVSFEELRWMFDWQMVRGITQLCQHLEGYSLRGIRKRDYPPSLFYQQPWWEKYRRFNDAVSRIGMVLAQGEPDFQVLVLHPQSSAWLHYDDDDNEGIQELFEDFLSVTAALESHHIAFHYGDERILSRHGRAAEGELTVGRVSYRVVIVPPADTLASSTVALLAEYADNGGELIWVGRKPGLAAGEPDDRIAELTTLGVSVAGPEAIVSRIPQTVRDISVTDFQGSAVAAITATKRSLPEDAVGVACRFYYFTNADQIHDYQAQIQVPGQSVQVLMPEDGTLREIPFSAQDGVITVQYTFPPCGSLALFAADEDEAFAPAEPLPDVSNTCPLEAERFAGQWELHMLDPNALTLDYCDVWFDGVLEAEHEHISVIQKRALELKRPVDIRMRFGVNAVEGYQAKELMLVMEQPDLYQIRLNGQAVPAQDCGCYRDTSFRRLDISGMLRPGHNQLELETTFTQSPRVYEQLDKAVIFEAEKNKLTYDHEIEAVYLVGRFGVQTPGTVKPLARNASRYAGAFCIGPAPVQADLGDLTYQGLPFFGGAVRLRKKITLDANAVEGRSLVLKQRQAMVVGVWVNDRHVIDWYWGPYSVSLDGYLQPGENVVELELVGTLRNLLGPHHLEEGESYKVHPGSFFKEPNIWGHSRWNDDYCFVEFGVTI